MSVISIIILLGALGVIMWAVNKFLPMAPHFKTLLNIVVLVLAVLWVLGLFGLIPDLNAIRVG